MLAPEVDHFLQRIRDGDTKETLAELNKAKASLSASMGMDYCRALCFLEGSRHDPMQARQALLEELRHFPQHSAARELLHKINVVVRPHLLPPPEIRQSEPLFFLLCDALLDYTMLSWPRLLHLFQSAREVGQDASRTGHIVECGTAGGGSAVMMAVAMASAETTKTSRRVYALDTFSGMPPPTRKDSLVLADQTRVDAEFTSWATGTCSAPSINVMRLAENFNVHDRVTVVEGLFQDTLPRLVSSTGPLTHDGVAMAHVDADWFDSTRCALTHLLPVMRRGQCGRGRRVVQIDDYNYWQGCRAAVDESLREWAASEDIAIPRLNKIDENAVFFEIP